jgi:NADP-dependent 3-hydroxy acid dehydrogenase YdfG
MMAITGHSSGIGRALYEKYPGSLGFDLTNGYDIRCDIDRIIDQSLHCSVFVNNAYSGNQQTELLQAWYAAHKNNQHVIVNISSVIGDLNMDVERHVPFLQKYAEHKRNLNRLSFEINCAGHRCRSIVIMPARVDTNFDIGTTDSDRVEQVLGKDNFLSTQDVVNAVDTALQSFNQRSFISAITISNL